MSQVWGGLHVDSDVPVAVKVMTGGAAWDPSFRTLFRNEVRAVARLNHPGVIAILDHGEMPAAVAAASEGRLVAGSPYLVMEYAGGGTLGKRQRRWSWTSLRRLLLALLDGLGHAHARGVVHRDLKPGNVLLAGPDDVRGGVKLTDFGIAWVGYEADAHTMAGTLQYMAPEQHAGDWVTYGPSTDLYALAALAWRIAVGQTPFAHRSGRAVARAHLFERPPDFIAQFHVPVGFEAWLRVLLHKDPQDRYRCAADAHGALLALGTVDDDRRDTGLGTSDARAARLEVFSGRAEPGVAPLPSGADVDAGVEDPPDEIAAIPERWQQDRQRVPLALRGAGLGLFELREVPLVGRERERDLLWRGIRAVDASGTPRVALVRGPAGVGKSRLVEWVMQCAHEAAGVSTLRIVADGVREGVATLLGVDRVDPSERHDVLTDRLKRCPDADLLVPTLVQGLDPDGGLEPHAFLAVVRRLLEWRGSERPVLLVLDDAHAAVQALELVHEVLDEPWDVPLPVFCLIVVRDENLVEIEGAEDRIARVLEAAHKPKVIALAPLQEAARRALLQDLALSGTLAARVDERTEGNPLFAIQLVGDWIGRELLELGPDGFVLTANADVEVPAYLTEVWSARMTKLLQPLPVVATIHLELAAALGLQIETEEWDRVCDDPRRGRVSDAGRQIRARVVEGLLDARLAERRPTGWAFVHPMLRETLAGNSRRQCRWAGHHAAIIEMLRAIRSSDPGRIGLHLIQAGQVQEAIDPLIASFPVRLRQRGVSSASAVYLPLKHAMEQVDLPESDVGWAVLWRYQSMLIRHQSTPGEARAWAERAQELAETSGDVEEWARCAYELASVKEQCGELEDGLWVLQKAAARLLRAGKRGSVLAWVLSRMALLARMMNRLDDADRWSSQCAALAERNPVADPELQGTTLIEMGVIASRRGQLERALQLFDEAEPLIAKTKSGGTLANLENNRGNVLKELGRLDEAEERFEASASAYDVLGYDAFIPRLNLILVRMRQSRHVEAAHIADSLLHHRRSPSRVNEALAALCRAVCDAAMGEWAGFQRRYHPAVEALRNARFVDPDLVFLLQHAGGYAEHAAQTDAASALWFFVREQAAAMGDEAGVAAASLTLENLALQTSEFTPTGGD